MLARVHYRLQRYQIHQASVLVDFPAMSASVVGGVLSLIIILIIGGSALGFTILILKIKKLKSEKQ